MRKAYNGRNRKSLYIVLAVVGLLFTTLSTGGLADAQTQASRADDHVALREECQLVTTQLGNQQPDFGRSLGLSDDSKDLGPISDERRAEGHEERFGLAVTSADATRLDELTTAFDADRKAGLHQAVRETVGGSFSGMWISLERGGYILATTDAQVTIDSMARVESRLPIVEVVHARNSKDTIDTEYDKIRERGDEMLKDAGITSGVVDVSCGMIIFNSNLDAAKATEVLEQYLEPGTFHVSPVEYESTTRNKWSAHDPHVGGVNIRPAGTGSGTFCTTNNVWLKGSEVWLLTAAHCIPPGNVNVPANAWDIFTTNNLHWHQGPSNADVDRVSRYNLQYAKFQGGTDAVAIQARLNHRGFSDDFHWIQDGFWPYTTHYRDTQSWISSVAGDQWPWIGYPVCTSGVGSNAPHCGNLYTVSGLGVVNWSSLGFFTWFHDMLHSYTYGCGGDSGAGGYYEVGGSYFLTGIVHGGPGNPCGGETFYSSVGWMHREIGLTKPYGM